MIYYGFKSVAKFPRSNPSVLGFSSAKIDEFAQATASLFATNEQGFAYDFNDLSAMYQDAAGTVPAAVGKSVGRVLDKSGRGNHLSQSASSSCPILRQNATTSAYYLEFDGADDFLVSSATIDFSAKNEVTLFAGLRKLSDAALGMLVELSPSTIGNSGAFYVTAPNGAAANLAFGSKGTSLVSAQTLNEFSAPISGVFYGYANIATPICSSYFNAGVMRSFTTSQGTGNYGNHLLYVGRRGGTSLPFVGHLYGLIATSRAMTTDEQNSVKNLMTKNTGA